MVSIIVPVYNGEKYISECIESILKQGNKNFELIVVNDGSTDDTDKICRKFSGIRYFCQNNQGVSMARQKGLQMAEGEYITFVDGDDTLKEDFLEKLTEEIKEYDMVCCNSSDSVHYAEDIYIHSDETITDKERIFKDYFSHKRYTFCIWGKLFRKSILQKIEFPKMEYAEDTYVIHRYFSLCRKVRLLKYDGYCYRHNEQGAMHRFMGSQEKNDMLQCNLYLCAECIQNYPSLAFLARKKLTECLFDLWLHFDIRNEMTQKAFFLAEKKSLKGKLLVLYKLLPKMPRKGLKIGICTLTDYENYGNRLQNYAVHYIFSRYGKVYNIGKRFRNVKYLLWRLTGGKIEKAFPKKNYRVYKLAYFSKKMHYSRRKADIYIYGSDQIWNPYYTDKRLICPCTKNNIAFCASFGLNDIPSEYQNLFCEGLAKFDTVSVREDRGAKIFFEYMGKNAEVLLDPTMYVPKEHWRSLEECPEGFENKDYIFEYLINGNNTDDFTIGEFLYLIDHAQSIVTDSFHVCVFAVIFEKKFTVKERPLMQSRIHTLLERAKNGIDWEAERRKTDHFIRYAFGIMHICP